MGGKGSEPCSLGKGACIRETEAAILVEIDGKQHWIPKSVLSDDSEVFSEEDEGEIFVKQWWAEKNSLD